MKDFPATLKVVIKLPKRQRKKAIFLVFFCHHESEAKVQWKLFFTVPPSSLLFFCFSFMFFCFFCQQKKNFFPKAETNKGKQKTRKLFIRLFSVLTKKVEKKVNLNYQNKTDDKHFCKRTKQADGQKKLSKVFLFRNLSKKVFFCFHFVPIKQENWNLPKIWYSRQFFPEITNIQKSLLRRANMQQLLIEPTDTKNQLVSINNNCAPALSWPQNKLSKIFKRSFFFSTQPSKVLSKYTYPETSLKQFLTNNPKTESKTCSKQAPLVKRTGQPRCFRQSRAMQGSMY